MAYHNYNNGCIGILAGMRPCGVIVLLSELFTTESKTQVYGCLHNYYSRHPTTANKIGAINVQSCPMIIFVTQHYTYMIEFICYDDACHLKRFARNPVRKDLTIQTKQLASVEMSVDKMHMKGHTDPWCKANCDPANFTKLNKVLQSSKSQVANCSNLIVR